MDLSGPSASHGDAEKIWCAGEFEADGSGKDISGLRRLALAATRPAAPGLSPDGVSALARPFEDAVDDEAEIFPGAGGFGIMLHYRRI